MHTILFVLPTFACEYLHVVSATILHNMLLDHFFYIAINYPVPFLSELISLLLLLHFLKI